MRTFLTVLGVSVGIGTVLFLVSLGYGLQRTILSRITTADALLSLDVSSGTSELLTLNKESIDKISQIEKIAEVSPVLNLSAQISMDDLTSDSLIYAIDPSYFRLSGIMPSSGAAFSSADSREVVISTAGAKLLDLNKADVIGKEIALTLFVPRKKQGGVEEVEAVKRDDKYSIVGVIDDDNSSFIFIPLNTISDLEINDYAQLKVKVSGNEFMEEARSKIIEQGFLVSSLSDTIDQANKIFKVVQIILSLFGLVALIVSAIGMFNTMTIALLERINEIGIMRSIGASSLDIRLLFLFESLTMGFLGGLGGVIIGYLGGEVANFGVNILSSNFGGQALDLFYRPFWFIGIIIVFSTFVGFLTGIYPSRRASKFNPLEALRYK